VDPNVFETANAGFAQVMYEEFLRNPAGVDPAWRELFEQGVAPANGNGADRPPTAPQASTAMVSTPTPAPSRMLADTSSKNRSCPCSIPSRLARNAPDSAPWMIR